MYKKVSMLALILLSSFRLCAQEEEIPWRKDITMLMVPREPMAVQVAQDISRRYPVLIVCYQATSANPILHAWNGENWVGISIADYTNGTFFTHRPRHAIVLEQQASPAPDILIPDGIWCDSGNRLTSTDTRVLIHLLGRYFDFPYRHWMQFAKRYNYELEEINPALINVPWVHYRGDKVIPAFKARDFDRDMNKWSTLDIAPPEPVAPVVIQEDPVLEPAEIPAVEIESELIEIPAIESIEPPDVIPDELLPPEKVVEIEPQAKHVEIIVEKTEPQDLVIEVEQVQKTVPEIIEEINQPAAEVVIDPFSTNEIPAAQVIAPAE